MSWKKLRRLLGVQEPNRLSPAAMERAIDKAMTQIEEVQMQIELAFKSGYNGGRDAQFFWDDPESNILPPDADTAYESYRNWQSEASYTEALKSLRESKDE